LRGHHARAEEQRILSGVRDAKGRVGRCQVGIGAPVGARLIRTTRRRGSARCSIWPSPAGTTGSAIMNPAVQTGIEIAAAVSAVITVTFVLAVRLFWRKGKSLREP
jgi:hypothetical protein